MLCVFSSKRSINTVDGKGGEVKSVQIGTRGIVDEVKYDLSTIKG